MTSFNQFTIVYHFGAINFSLWLRLSWPCRSEEHGMSIAWDPGRWRFFLRRSWGRMVTVLARILRIWGSKPEGGQDLCHGPWSFKLICVCELWSSHLKWMDSFIMSYLHRNDIQTISKPSLWGGLTTTHKRETTNPPARLRHQPMSSMRSASSKTRQDTWDRFVHGMPL